MSAAFDSLIIIFGWASLIAIIGLLFSIVSPKIPGFYGWRFFRRKFFLLPSILFVLTLFIMPVTVDLPITPYKGPNEVGRSVFGNLEYQFTMYDNEAYTNQVILYVTTQLPEGHSVTVTVDFLQNDVVVDSIQVTLADSTNEAEVSKSLTPGEYEIMFTEEWYDDGTPTDSLFANMQVSQEMTEEHIQELVDWDTARFIMVLSSFFLLLVGICVDTGTVEEEKESKPDDLVYRSYDV